MSVAGVGPPRGAPGRQWWPARADTLTPPLLERRLRALGVTLLLAHLAWVPLALLLAQHSPFGAHQPEEAALFAQLGFGAWFSEGSVFSAPVWRLAVVALWLAAATIPALAALYVVPRAPGIDARVVDEIFRFAVGFAAAAILAYPVFTQDVWIGIGWGRMFADGVNAYYTGLSAAGAEGLPLPPIDMRFTWGPLWAGVLTLAALLSFGSPWLALLWVKLVLAACWIGCLGLVRRATRDAGPRDQAVALLLLGWLPLGLHFGLAEAHNDVALVLGILCWLTLVGARPVLGVLGLAASMLTKYVSGPLFLLPLWQAIRGPRELRPRRLAALAVGLAAVAFGLSLVAQDLDFLAGTDEQRFIVLTPGHALALVAGVSKRFGNLLVGAGILAASIPMGVAFLREPSDAGQRALTFVALALAALVVVGHTWPWYLTWPLAVGCLVWRWWMFRALLAVFVAAPFFDLLWAQGHGWSAGDPFTLGIWVVIATLMIPFYRLLPGSENPGAPPGVQGSDR